jgi:hypothetical protein
MLRRLTAACEAQGRSEHGEPEGRVSERCSVHGGWSS